MRSCDWKPFTKMGSHMLSLHLGHQLLSCWQMCHGSVHWRLSYRTRLLAGDLGSDLMVRISSTHLSDA